MLQGSVGCTAAAALRRRADARSIRRSRWKRGVVKSTGVKFAQELLNIFTGVHGTCHPYWGCSP